MSRGKTYEQDRGALTLRLPPDLHQELREYKLFTNTPINDLTVRLLREFMKAQGREEIAQGMTRRAREMYGPALDKLADS